MSRFYITTPIYYVNASPHIGHSYTSIAADCLARYMRGILGEDKVWFLTGTDEHGQKIQKAAEAKKIGVQDFVDSVVSQFNFLWEELNISHNDFLRTTQERHITCVQRALEILYKKGDIYSAKYEGWYCVPCETFWTETQIQDYNCPDCKRPLERISETNYFFKLSQYQQWLLDYIKNNPDFIRPESRYEEVLSFLKLNTLLDLCVSRPKERLSWGIPLPFSPEHVTYVWFDALINYISAVGSFNKDGIYNSRWWGSCEVVHLVGKDILRQHAVYWPIMLHALGINLPKTVFAHGWWLTGSDKMSKSKGNVISPLEMVRKFGIDAYRYFLLRDVPFGLDGNFSEEALVKRLNSDLANDLGNLVYRTLTMIEKYYDGVIPSGDLPDDDRSLLIINKMERLDEEVSQGLRLPDINFVAALETIWQLINMANKYIEDAKPWNLLKEDKNEQLEAFIRLLVAVIKKVAKNIVPFMPTTAWSIQEQLGSDKIKKGRPLFPRIEIKI